MNMAGFGVSGGSLQTVFYGLEEVPRSKVGEMSPQWLSKGQSVFDSHFPSILTFVLST